MPLQFIQPTVRNQLLFGRIQKDPMSAWLVGKCFRLILTWNLAYKSICHWMRTSNTWIISSRANLMQSIMWKLKVSWAWLKTKYVHLILTQFMSLTHLKMWLRILGILYVCAMHLECLTKSIEGMGSSQDLLMLRFMHETTKNGALACKILNIHHHLMNLPIYVPLPAWGLPFAAALLSIVNTLQSVRVLTDEK